MAEIVTFESLEPIAEYPTNVACSPGINEASFEIFGLVNCPKLNLRRAPNYKSSIIAVLSKGTKVRIDKDANDKFYKVTVLPEKSLYGFVDKQYIDLFVFALDLELGKE